MAHSQNLNARPTFRRGFGFHPLAAFVAHGRDGTGEPLAMLPRPGNAGSTRVATTSPSSSRRRLRRPITPRPQPGIAQALIRADGARSAHRLIEFPAPQRLGYSFGFVLLDHSLTCSKTSTRRTRGGPPATRTTGSATAPGSPNSPACGCGSPTWTGCANYSRRLASQHAGTGSAGDRGGNRERAQAQPFGFPHRRVLVRDAAARAPAAPRVCRREGAR